jgi:hypothetical protein
VLKSIDCQPNIVCPVVVRYFSPKSRPMDDGTYRGEMPRRFGYEPHHHTRGLLPRLTIKERRLPSMPITAKEDPWSKRLARQGENDFVKILSDEDIEQHELLTHIPDWLRGYRNMSKEYSVLMRKRQEFNHWKYSKPLKWDHLQARIRYLYKRINNKYKPPDVERLSPSRYMP